MEATAKTRNGTDTTTEPSMRAALATADAFGEYYLAALDTGLRLQARGLESIRSMIDEAAGLQKAQRRLAEQFLQNARRGQEELISATENNLKAGQTMLERAGLR
jgi:hypothetical protein